MENLGLINKNMNGDTFKSVANKRIKMKKRLVEVEFKGTVEVLIPDDVSDFNASLLAPKLALAKILATTENIDAPEDQACEEYLKEAYHALKGLNARGKTPSEKDWDESSATVVTGVWNEVKSDFFKELTSEINQVEKD